MMKVVLTLIAVLAVGLIGYAFYANWINVETKDTGDGDGKGRVEFSYDKEKAKRDMEEAKKKIVKGAEEAAEDLQEAAKKVGKEVEDTAEDLAVKDLTGTVREVDAAGNRLVVESGDQRHVFRLGDKVSNAGEVKVGDEVTVKYEEEDGVKVARDVQVKGR